MPKPGDKVPDMGTATTTISNTLFTRTQARVLRILFARPVRRYYLNEILAMANGGSGAIRRELDRLLAAGLVEKSSEGNRQYYQANLASPVFKELQALIARLLKDERRVDPRLVPGTGALCRRHGVKRLALFGSAARGDMNAESDLDLLVEFMPDEAPTLVSLTRLKDELETLFAHSVDLATPAILNNPHRRKAIEKDMEVIYERKGSRVPVGHARRRN